MFIQLFKSTIHTSEMKQTYVSCLVKVSHTPHIHKYNGLVFFFSFILKELFICFRIKLNVAQYDVRVCDVCVYVCCVCLCNCSCESECPLCIFLFIIKVLFSLHTVISLINLVSYSLHTLSSHTYIAMQVHPILLLWKEKIQLIK